jgi:hypothetical protein
MEVTKKIRPADDTNHQKSHSDAQQSSFVVILSLCALFAVGGAYYHVTCRINNVERRIANLELELEQHRLVQPQTPRSEMSPQNGSSFQHNYTEQYSNSTNKMSPVTELNFTTHLPIDDELDDTESSGAGQEDNMDDDTESSGSDEQNAYLSWEKYPMSSSSLRRRRRSVSDDDEDETDAMYRDEPAGVGRQDERHRDRRRQQQDGGIAVASSTDQRNRQTRHRNSDRKKPKTTDERAEKSQQRLASNLAIKAAHFHPDGHDRQYTSSSHPPVTFTFWEADSWAANQSFYHLNTKHGIVTVLESGLYMIYAQLVYHDLSGRWSFGIYVNDRERFKCLDTERIQHHVNSQQLGSSSNHGVYQHCYTSAIQRLDRFDKLSIRCLYGSRTVLTQPEFTFWGFVKLSD